MLVGLSGPSAAGKSTIASYLLNEHEFELLLLGSDGASVASNDASLRKDGLWFQTAEALSDFMLADNNWQRDFVIDSLGTFAALDVLRRRPFFVLLYVDAPVSYRARRLSTGCSDSTLLELIKRDDSVFHDLALLNSLADLRIVNSAPSLAAFNSDLSGFISPSSLSERCRPSWDTYFMHLASLAARRSNCMKRRVGCILVRDRRVIATGYNGTPRGVRNCSEGGCARCNGGAKCGTALDTCLCLHAEENALLEAGRERIEGHPTSTATLYCNTCPCLQCAKRLVQVGIREVVYSQAYGMDSATRMLLSEAGVKLRQFRAPETSDILMCEEEVTEVGAEEVGVMSNAESIADSLNTLAV